MLLGRGLLALGLLRPVELGRAPATRGHERADTQRDDQQKSSHHGASIAGVWCVDCARSSGRVVSRVCVGALVGLDPRHRRYRREENQYDNTELIISQWR